MHQLSADGYMREMLLDAGEHLAGEIASGVWGGERCKSGECLRGKGKLFPLIFTPGTSKPWCLRCVPFQDCRAVIDILKPNFKLSLKANCEGAFPTAADHSIVFTSSEVPAASENHS